jgi:hypothetical protein
MTDRYKSVVIILENDIRSDDLENLKQLLLTLRGVKAVEPGAPCDMTYNLAYAEARTDIQGILFKTLSGIRGPKTAEDIEIKDKKR